MATRARQVEAQQRIGRAIKVWARIRDLPISELAERIGMKRQSLYERLRGDATLGIAELEHIAEVLDVGVADLLAPPASWTYKTGPDQGEDTSAWELMSA